MRRGLQNASVREPAVAGAFYPADAAILRRGVLDLLDATTPVALPAPLKALIVPHAGYAYSGAVAAAAYSLVRAGRDRIRRVVLIGPSHRVPLQGIAVPEANHFRTPLGPMPIDLALRDELLRRDDVVASDWPHASEHCLEVQLPFLQSILPKSTLLLPLVAGLASPQHVASVLAQVWGGHETVVIASSDLSHYHRYDAARMIDAATCASIQAFDSRLSGEQACGAVGINGLLRLAANSGSASWKLRDATPGTLPPIARASSAMPRSPSTKAKRDSQRRQPPGATSATPSSRSRRWNRGSFRSRSSSGSEAMYERPGSLTRLATASQRKASS
jgi:AmmeMemoRadiSam system protein B